MHYEKNKKNNIIIVFCGLFYHINMHGGFFFIKARVGCLIKYGNQVDRVAGGTVMSGECASRSRSHIFCSVIKVEENLCTKRPCMSQADARNV
jgi:hypothetical protein